MKLLRPDVDIPGKDIVHNDVFDKGAPVVLFLIESPGIVKGNIRHGTKAKGSSIVTGAKHGIFQPVAGAKHRPECLLPIGKGILPGYSNPLGNLLPVLAQQGSIC